MRWVVLAAVLALGGCNVVATTTPMFTKADEAGAPGLRHGVWSGAPDPSCAFDEATPFDRWPDCARGVVVGDGTVGGNETVNGAVTLSTTDYVLAAGDPRVLQFHDVQAATESSPARSVYLYAGLRAKKTDSRGRITAYAAWLVQCGPPPPQGTVVHKVPRYGTLKPLPGMIMDADGNGCTTTSASAIRDAAKASETWSPDLIDSHWVRDGER